MQEGKAVLPLGTLTVEETKAPNGYLLDGAYMQAGDKSEQIKGLYVTQITEDGDLAVLSGSNQFSVSDQVIRGGVKIQKRDLETGNTKPQGSATLKDTAFDIISLNDNAVLVEGKLYKKNEVVKTIRTDIEGVGSTSADLLQMCIRDRGRNWDNSGRNSMLEMRNFKRLPVIPALQLSLIHISDASACRKRSEYLYCDLRYY